MADLDTGDPQGAPPSSSNASEDVRGGAGVSPDLDRVASEATELGDPAAPLWSMGQCSKFSVEVLALLDRVRVLEAVAEAARDLEENTVNLKPEFRDPDSPFERLTAALAVLGGDRPHE